MDRLADANIVPIDLVGVGRNHPICRQLYDAAPKNGIRRSGHHDIAAIVAPSHSPTPRCLAASRRKIKVGTPPLCLLRVHISARPFDPKRRNGPRRETQEDSDFEETSMKEK